MKTIFQFFVLFFIFQTICINICRAIECKISQNPSKVAYTITVSQSGGANFTTVKEAIDYIPSGNDEWIKISLSPGIYKEQVQITRDKECIFIEGSDRTTTTITFDAHTNTSESVTFGVLAENFVAKGVTFQNSYNRAQEDELNQNPIVPAVAFGCLADKQAFYSCGFEGYQDTLFDDNGRHYFSSCYIEGVADFIWGDGQSVYEQCTINVTGDGFITAQGRKSSEDPGGYVFRGSSVTGTGHTFLGRGYRAFSRVIFIDSYFTNNIDPLGWVLWEGDQNEVIYAEVNCTGPGNDTSHRVPWEKKLDSSQIGQYDTQTFINQDGWISKLPV